MALNVYFALSIFSSAVFDSRPVALQEFTKLTHAYTLQVCEGDTLVECRVYRCLPEASILHESLQLIRGRAAFSMGKSSAHIGHG